jgi:aspartate racemase
MFHIGILAHSAEGAALCFLAACHEGSRRLGPHQHPDVTLSILPMGPSLPAWERLDLVTLRATFLETARRLRSAGADFFVCPDNTAHIALEAPGEPFPLPGLHIAEVVAGEAEARGHRTVGVLGTRWTMEGPVYAAALGRRGLGLRVPEPDDRAMIDRVIFDELCRGVFREESRRDYVRVIEGLRDRGCDAVALSCTEIPLLVTPEVSPLPTLDSTRLLAKAAVEVALGARPLPSWRGGPLAAETAAAGSGHRADA